MKIYIAGKITGDKGYREKFAAVEAALWAQGFTVINPAVLPEGMRPADYMRICFAMVDIADEVVFFSGGGAGWRCGKPVGGHAGSWR